MNKKQTSRSPLFRLLLSGLFYIGLSFVSLDVCAAAEGGQIFSVDIDKQKSDIEKGLEKLQDFLLSLKFQDARGQIDLLEHKLDRVKKDLGGEDAQAYAGKIDKAKSMLASKEDSLVNISFVILKSQGPDSALMFTRNELRGRGVSETKIGVAEKRILEEGPAIRQAKEQEEIAQTLKLLESGQTPPESTNPFVLQSAQRILRIRADSIKAIEDAKAKKELEERQRLEAIKREKEAKEKKIEEVRLAKQKKEEEKKRHETEEAEKKRLAAEQERQKQLQEQQEKAHRDSIEMAR